MTLKCAVLVSASFLGLTAAGGAVLAERGRPPVCTVVISKTPSACERYAAEELRDYVEKATGVRMHIGSAVVPGMKSVFVGESALRVLEEPVDALGEDGFRIAERDGDVLVAGSPKRGVLYGVYELLEKFAGIRWYSSWHQVVPRQDVIAIPAGYDHSEIPSFEMREPFWYDVLEHPEFAARLRVNSRSWRTTEEKYGGMPFRFGGGLASCHTFNTLMPPDEFFASHPEYFSLEGGRRVKNPSQLCLTNPDVVRIVAERVLERIRRDPGAKFYGVSQNDWKHYCQCERCKAVDEEEGSHSGTLARFVNAIAEAVEKEFPDALIETLAYDYTRKPPRKTRLRHNVVPCVSTIGCDFSRPLYASKYKGNVSLCEDIVSWSRQTENLYVWDYVTDFGGYTTPFANVLNLQDNLRFFRRNGAKFVFEQGDMDGCHGDFAELKAWLLAKWMWNPEVPAEILLNDFFRGYYGRAAGYVRAYFGYVHRLQYEKLADGTRPLSICPPDDRKPYSDEFFAHATRLWAKAMNVVSGDPATSYNVRMGAFSVDCAKLEWLREKNDKVLWLSAREADLSHADEMRELARSLLARMDEARHIRLSEADNTHRDRVSAWRRLARGTVPSVVRGARRGEVQDRDLSLIKKGVWGEYVDDPKASDGSALKLFGTHQDWCVRFFMNRLGYDDGVVCRLRMRARVEKAGEGAAFAAGVYDPVAKKMAGSRGFRTSEVSENYEWYDICKFTPNDNQWFWAAPGVFDSRGRSSVRAVFIDKIELTMEF